MNENAKHFVHFSLSLSLSINDLSPSIEQISLHCKIYIFYLCETSIKETNRRIRVIVMKIRLSCENLAKERSSLKYFISSLDI